MGLFDRFRKRPATPQSPVAVSLEQLCYDIAYFILPQYAFDELPNLTDLCLEAPYAADPYFLVKACLRRNIEPNIKDAKKLHWHHGPLSAGINYFVLQYPTPRPIDFTGAPLEKLQEVRD